MKTLASLSWLAVLLFFLGTLASAQCPSGCLFYGGDFNPASAGADGLANENDLIVGGNPYGAATLPELIVGRQGWNITGLVHQQPELLTPIQRLLGNP